VFHDHLPLSRMYGHCQGCHRKEPYHPGPAEIFAYRGESREEAQVCVEWLNNYRRVRAGGSESKWVFVSRLEDTGQFVVGIEPKRIATGLDDAHLTFNLNGFLAARHFLERFGLTECNCRRLACWENGCLPFDSR
jgi:hypothetical protein